MRILFVVNSLVGGGAEKVFWDMINNLPKDKFDITVLSIDDIGVYRKKIKSIVSYKTVIKHADSPFLLHYFRGALAALWAWMFRNLSGKMLYGLIIREKYDIEVAYLEGMATKLVAGSNNSSSIKYAWIHTDVLKNPWTRNQFRNELEEKRCYGKMDHVIAVSESVKKAAEIKFSIQAMVKYNVLDDKYIWEIAKYGKRSLSKKTSMAFVSVGSLWKIKGYVRLVKIFAELLEDGYNTELHLIGTGEDEQIIKEYIKTHGVGERIIMHGFQEAPYDLMLSADAYICPSYAEGFSTSVTEALILGIPVITTDCAGMKELLGDSEFGYIVENTDEGLKGGIKEWLEFPEKVRYFKDKAVIRGREFSVVKRIEELQNMFEKDINDEK